MRRPERPVWLPKRSLESVAPRIRSLVDFLQGCEVFTLPADSKSSSTLRLFNSEPFAMLLARISVPPPEQPEPEDIFASALTTIFTDDTVNSHGTPGSYVTYHSPQFGDLNLHIPAHPDVEDGRKLFAHYLWNAAVVAADGIETASADGSVSQASPSEPGKVCWDRRYFDLRGKRTLELGAGTALPSIIAALSGANSCTITDHPSSPALTTGAIEKNVHASPFSRPKSSFANNPPLDNQGPPVEPRSGSQVDVYGYTWGTSTFYLPSVYGKPAPPNATPSHFNRIIIADCLWMPSQHINLIRTILQYLPPAKSAAMHNSGNGTSHGQDEAEDVSCALVVAGFHTGRPIVADFFNLATEAQPAASSPITPNASQADHDPATINTRSLDLSILTDDERSVCGQLRLADIFEVDVDLNRREWRAVREGEGKWDAKRWCVVGVLVRR